MNVSTLIATDPHDPYGTRQAYSDALTKLGTPEAKVLKLQLQAEGLLLNEPDADGETKAAKAAKLTKLKRAKAAAQAELSRINAELRRNDSDDSQMAPMDPEEEDAEATDGYDDDSVYETQSGDPNEWEENSKNRSQPHLRPGAAKSSTPTASETFSTRSTVSMGEGKDVVAQAKRLAAVHGLDWTDLRSRERAFAMALRKN